MVRTKIDVNELRCPHDDCTNLECLLAFGTKKTTAKKCIESEYPDYIPFTREGTCDTCKWSKWKTGEGELSWDCTSPVPKPWPNDRESKLRCPGWSKGINKRKDIS